MFMENSEDRMFKDLLTDYAAPVADEGFSDHVLASLPRTRDTQRLKLAAIGSAFFMASLIFIAQLPSLFRLLARIQTPKSDTPHLLVPDITGELATLMQNLTGNPIYLVMAGTILLMVMWMAGTLANE
ncbi:MAG TPA: hypothetical protein ENJ46_02280 [Hellea balneolensis]|uniref:Uncharacterized protein n=1 Tax=Hellea balneolensis TaxID=287478 RepID=A0A7C3CBV1_9PROT|nr:hypothetical protein [Hellea balneolensis]